MTRTSRSSMLVGLLLVVVATGGTLVLRWTFVEPPNDKSPPPLQLPDPVRAREAFSPVVRVNLTPRAVPSVELQVDGPFTIRPLGSSRVLGAESRLASTRVTAVATGLRVGNVVYPVSRLELVPESAPAIWIDGHQYRGAVRIFRRSKDRLLVVNALPVDEYVASVIDSEMPAAFPDSARRAQAIVARTYALSQMQAARAHPYFDLFATPRSQKYLGVQYRTSDGRRLAGESENSRRLARETAGMVCTHAGRIFTTYYSAVCGGRTTRGTALFADAAAPLQSVVCEWCRPAERYRWLVATSRRELAVDLKEFFRRKQQTFGDLASLTLELPVPAGEIPTFVVSDGRRQQRLKGTDLRDHLTSVRLWSPHFTIEEDNDRFQFAGRGHGHGVGLCQWGARGQAMAGRTALEILQHYYPGSRVVILE